MACRTEVGCSEHPALLRCSTFPPVVSGLRSGEPSPVAAAADARRGLTRSRWRTHESDIEPLGTACLLAAKHAMCTERQETFRNAVARGAQLAISRHGAVRPELREMLAEQ